MRRFYQGALPTNTFPETIIQGSFALEALPSFFALRAHVPILLPLTPFSVFAL
jgi:hypothetical protein